MPSLQPAGGHCATVRGCGRCTTWSLIGRELRATSLRAVGWPSTTRICSVTTLSWIGDPAVAPRMAFGDALVKALIGDGPLLTLPGWRPALLMLTSGFAGLLPATAGRTDPPDFHHAPLSAASLENPYHAQASAAQAGREPYAVHCAACPKAPNGFKVQLYADGLATPRVIRVAPNADVFVAESGGGQIRAFRGLNADGRPERSEVFAANLNQPYGIAFYPAGPDPQWIYVGDTDSVVRFPYRNGDLKATGVAARVVDLPHGSGHWTRDVVFSAGGKTLFVAVGSESNVDDTYTSAVQR